MTISVTGGLGAGVGVDAGAHAATTVASTTLNAITIDQRLPFIFLLLFRIEPNSNGSKNASREFLASPPPTTEDG
jgi:hypothetical protein